MDMVATYAASKAWALRPCIVLVEGTSDEKLFALADRLSVAEGKVLLGNDICVVAAGRRDRGGTFGVARELITLRSMVPLVLSRHGNLTYRVIGLVDNDYAGRRIISDLLRLDRGASEFRDIIAMRPVAKPFSSFDPQVRRQECELLNLPYRNLDWEIEDNFSPRIMQLFENNHPGFVPQKVRQGGKTHHEFTKDAKTALHRFAHRTANLHDLAGIVEIVDMLRSIFNLNR